MHRGHERAPLSPPRALILAEIPSRNATAEGLNVPGVSRSTGWNKTRPDSGAYITEFRSSEEFAATPASRKVCCL